MPEPLPKFDHPPIVETVLSVQFARLPKYRSVYAGSFWNERLSSWKNIQETGRLDDCFERFGDHRRWGQPGLRFFNTPEIRTQITSDDGSRMVQMQDSRFVYNWKRVDGSYPSFDKTYDEFSSHYGYFKEFVAKADLGQIEENQWEVQYVNHLIKDDLWKSPDDWRRIFPWLNFPSTAYAKPDYLQCEWSSVIGENSGRLHTNLSFARVALNGPEALILTLTSRGAISSDSGTSLETGLSVGHEIIVRSFTDMTSDWAHDRWGRTQ